MLAVEPLGLPIWVWFIMIPLIFIFYKMEKWLDDHFYNTGSIIIRIILAFIGVVAVLIIEFVL